MKATVKLSGFSELEAEMKGLKDRATSRRVAVRSLTQAGETIAARARQLAPDDPKNGVGNYLPNAIKVGRAAGVDQSAGNSGQTVTVFIGIDPTVKPKVGAANGVAAYSIFAELGTTKRKAHPFMRPAFDEMKDEAVEAIGTILAEEIAKTKARAARKAARSGG
jgi:HK97 gp10 family phage protein